MSQSREALTIMAESSPTFGKATSVAMPRWAALLLAAGCVTALIITGFTTYSLSGCHGDVAPLNGPSAGLAATTAASRRDVTTKAPATVIDVRLPTNVIPEKYHIELLPFLEEGNFTFVGSIAILLNVTAPAARIVLHAHDTLKLDSKSTSLTILDYSADPPSATGLPIARQHTDASRQQLIVTPNSTLRPGRYRLRLKFSGILGTGLKGFYRSSYRVGNETRWVATTQFQATDARRAFPCFDEPALKARFRLRLGRPRNMTTVSNMLHDGGPQPVVPVTKRGRRPDMPGYVWDTFQESVPMSTYLVAFAVTDFARLSDNELFNFTVWAKKDAVQQATYALHIGPRILRFFETYYDIPYPLPKMDMLALPDFAAGAMENWGLITFRETAMLYQEGVSAIGNKQRVATVVAHELAHQWFGNLVTPSWWSDLWLNEGFASYVEYLGVNAVEPDWMILDQLVVSEVQMVFGLDALKTSHPISVEVGNPDEINEIFDRISYAKGASIIRMMDHFLTTEVFKKGVTNYLKNRAFSSATQNQLWEALTSQAHEDGALSRNITIKEIMDTWTLQTGYPVVTVNRSYSDNAVFVKQERFLLIESSNNDIEDKRQQPPLWWIPLTFTTRGKRDFNTTRPSHWLKDASLRLDNIDAAPEEWVIFNVQETGFYRVNYDAENWRMLADQLRDPDRFREIAVPNRAQLVDDALNLARAGLLNYSLALDMTRYLRHETEYIPWKSALSALQYIDAMFATSGHYDIFKKYMLHLMMPLYEEVGFTDNSSDPLLLIHKRVQHLNWVCGLGHRGCVHSASELFEKWRNSSDPDTDNPVPANLKSVVYCTALRYGDQAEWDFAWERYTNSIVSSEKDLLLSALGCSREPWILTRYIERALTESAGIRKQDVARVFNSVASTVIGRPIAAHYLRDKWQRVNSYVGSSLFTMNTIVRGTLRRINTKYDLMDLRRFADDHRHELAAVSRQVLQCIEQAEANIDWMEKNFDHIVRWLQNVTSELS